MFDRFTERAWVYCPSCHTPIESIGTEMASGCCVVEGDGAVWHHSYRVEWRMAGDEGG